MTRIFYAVLFAAMFFCCPGNAQDLGVFPSVLNFHLQQGETETKEISISNTYNKPIKLKLYLSDWLRDSIGGHGYYQLGTVPQSCAGWVTLEDGLVEIKPDETVKIPIKLAVPDEAEADKKMKWAMLFAEIVEDRPEQGKGGAMYSMLRMGIHIYQTPPELTDKSVKVTAIRKHPKKEKAYQMICENTGELMLNCKARLEMTNASGEQVTPLVMEFPMFPGQRRYVTYDLTALPAGKYTAKAIIEEAGEDLQTKNTESQIEIK